MKKIDTLTLLLASPRILMFLLTIGALIFSLRSWNKFKYLRFIAFYCAVCLVQDGIGVYYAYVMHWRGWGRIVNSVSLNLFLLIEYILCSGYLVKLIQSKSKKNAIKISRVFFLLFLLVSWITRPVIFYREMPNYLFVLESIFLIIPCLIYFYELFKYPKPSALQGDPNFWVVCGVFFLNACSFPLFLSLDFILQRMQEYASIIYSLNYILYSILFILFIRAFLCNIQAENQGTGSAEIFGKRTKI